MTECPRESVLLRQLRGELDGLEAARVKRHLTECAECVQRVANIEQRLDRLAERLKRAVDDDAEL